MTASSIVTCADRTRVLVVGEGVIPRLPRIAVSKDGARGSYNLRDAVCVFDCITQPEKSRVFTIPKGFVSDLASIPRIFFSLIARDDLGLPAPVVHDFLYRYGGRITPGSLDATYTRAEADRLFLEVMKLDGVPAWKRQAAYRAVRLFGGRSFNR